MLLQALALALTLASHYPWVAASSHSARPIAAGMQDAVVDGAWRLLPPPNASPLVYDATTRCLFAMGLDGGLWQFDTVARVWSALPASADFPGPFVDQTLPGLLFQDPVRRRVLIASLDQLWVFDLASRTWTVLGPSHSLTYALGIAYDPPGDRVLYDAAFSLERHRSQLIYHYDRRVWQWRPGVDSARVAIPVSDSVSIPRQDGSTVFDPVRDRLLAFRGDFQRLYALTLDTSSDWDSVDLSGALPDGSGPRTSFYDPLSDRILSYANPGDISALPLIGSSAWAALATDGAPPTSGPIIFDPDQDRLLMMIGSAVWQYSIADQKWRLLESGGPKRELHSMVYDDPGHRLVTFGGSSISDSSVYDDVWNYDLASGTWTQALVQGTPPPSRVAAAALLDPDGRAMLIFGGGDSNAPGSTGYYNDVWRLNLDGPSAWQALSPLGTAPTPRWGTGAVYDPIDQQAIFFGGSDAGGYNNQIWCLALRPALVWHRLTPAGDGPPTVYNSVLGGTAAYDSRRHRLLVLGTDSLAWAVNLSGAPAWQRISDRAPAGFSDFARAWYDSIADRLVAGTGWYDVEQPWQLILSDGRWSPLVPSGTAPLNPLPAVAFDDRARRWFVEGGAELEQPTGLTTLEFASAATTAVLISLIEAKAVDGGAHLVWLAPDRERSYRIECRANDAPWSDRGSIAPDGSQHITYDDRALIPDVRYGYRVRIDGGDAFGEAWVQIPPSSRLALSRPVPDPVSDQALVRVTLANAAPAAIDVFDLRGRRVLSVPIAKNGGAQQQVRIDVSRFEPGIYFMRLRSGRAVVSRRLIVAR